MAQKNLSKIVANFKTSLATNLPIGSTTATIQTNIDRDGNVMPDGVFTFSISVNASNLEQIICDKVGTTLSNIRSVNLQTRTYTIGTNKKHNIGEPLAITDYSSFGVVADLLNGVQGLDKDTPLAFDGALVHTGNIEEVATIRDILSYTGTTFVSPVVTVTGSTGSTPATTLTIPVVVSGTNPALIVSLSTQQSVALTSITCNGVPVPTIASKDRSTGDLKALIAILAAPTTGNIVITMASAVNMSAVCTVVQNYNGVQVVGTGSDGNGTAITSTVTSTSQSLVIDAVAFNSGSLSSVTPPQNLLDKVDTVTTAKKVAQSMESSLAAVAVQTDYTTSTTTDWASISVALNTVTVGGFLKLDGTNSMQADLDFGVHKGVNAVDPTNPQDVATKKYVDDTAIAGAPNASITVKGIVQEATQAEVNNGTDTGSTGARLFVPPSKLNSAVVTATGISAQVAETVVKGQAGFISKDEHLMYQEVNFDPQFAAVSTITSPEALSQIFTVPSYAGQIQQISFDAIRSGSGSGWNGTFELRTVSAGLPTNTVIHTTIHGVDDAGTTVVMNVSSVTLVPGVDYAIVFKPDNLSPLTMSIYGRTGVATPMSFTSPTGSGSWTPIAAGNGFSVAIEYKLQPAKLYPYRPREFFRCKSDGVFSEDFTTGTTASLVTSGALSTLSGLTVGADYFASPLGIVTTTAGGDYIGTAVNATTLQVRIPLLYPSIEFSFTPLVRPTLYFKPYLQTTIENFGNTIGTGLMFGELSGGGSGTKRVVLSTPGYSLYGMLETIATTTSTRRIESIQGTSNDVRSSSMAVKPGEVMIRQGNQTSTTLTMCLNS